MEEISRLQIRPNRSDNAPNIKNPQTKLQNGQTRDKPSIPKTLQNLRLHLHGRNPRHQLRYPHLHLKNQHKKQTNLIRRQRPKYFQRNFSQIQKTRLKFEK